MMTTGNAVIASAVTAATTAVDVKAQEFAHRLVEFADFDKCCAFFTERNVDFNQPNAMGWSILMSVCACGRADMVGFVADATENVSCATAANRTNVLHLAAMSKNPLVIQELVAKEERRAKLQAIVNQPNINGDTPLMMACVAKNVEAVKVLLSDLHADPSYKNANGMTPLMCAARLADGTDSVLHEELMLKSKTIVDILLKRGDVQVNAMDRTAGNTALHLALLSTNIAAVEILLTGSLKEKNNLDIMLKNKAGFTAIDISEKMRAPKAILEMLRTRRTQLEYENERIRQQAVQELMRLDGTETKKSCKKTKKKPTPPPSRPIKQAEPTNKQGLRAVKEKMQDAADEKAESVSDSSVTTLLYPSQLTPNDVEKQVNDDTELGDWQSVSTKKSRWKASNADEKKAETSLSSIGKPRSRPRSTVQKKHQSSQSMAQPGAPHTSQHASPAVASKPIVGNKSSSVPSLPSVPLIALQKIQRDQPEEDEEGLEASSAPLSPTASFVSYEQLDTIFKRTFSMADEMDIGVEKFIIASSSTEQELQPDNGLSISQVEVLQEAHLQAYHYLNEKKMELTRILERERLEAQYALQHEILQLK